MQKTRILIVDDEPDITLLVKLSLEQSGEFEVQEENQATHALAAAREFNPDLIILDIMMPTLGGGDVAALIDGDPKLRGTPLIFMTATVMRERLGADTIDDRSFIAKPIETRTLIACINRNLRKAGVKS